MKVLGIMSGTSLDGMDMALVEFHDDTTPSYRILAARTMPYSPEWEERLRRIYHGTAKDLAALDAAFGIHTGERILDFLDETGVRPDLIASHGQTVFHEPAKHYTCQIGSGPHIAAITGITTVYDFRRQDVALGGQGAPLVPIGDKQLFGHYDYCLNIGGFANISFDDEHGIRRAFDTGPANIVLNKLARQEGKPYDDGGAMASRGHVIPSLLEMLNGLAYYHQEKQPKSLGWEMVERDIVPLLTGYEGAYPTEDLLHTFVHHIAWHIGQAVPRYGKMLVTGGGAYNDFLLSTIEQYAPVDLVVPHPDLIDYKEALIFAYMGWLRIQGKVNVLASVTGACCDHSSGLIAEAVK